jgi:calcium/proton exchanger cax
LSSSRNSSSPKRTRCFFLLSVAAIIPLAALLSLATESVADKTGDLIGGLLNATLGNLTELLIALAALRAGQYVLVKASIEGAIVTNSLFMLGASFLLGGLKHHVQEYNRDTARLQAGMLFLATIAMLIPSLLAAADNAPSAAFTHSLSVSLSVLLIITYGLGLMFSLKTHRELFAGKDHHTSDEKEWPLSLALGTLAAVTVLVALVSEVFVESVQQAAVTLGITPAFVGIIIVALVGGAAEMVSAFSAARKDKLDLECRDRAGQRGSDRTLRCSSTSPHQLFDWSRSDGPSVLARRSCDDADRGRDGDLCHQYRPIGLVHWSLDHDRLRHLCHNALPTSAADLADLERNAFAMTAVAENAHERKSCPGSRCDYGLPLIDMVGGFSGFGTLTDISFRRAFSKANCRRLINQTQSQLILRICR